MKKEKVIKVYVDKHELRWIKIRAEKAGLSVSNFCREIALNRHVKNKLSAEEIKLFKEFIHISNSIIWIGNMVKNYDPNGYKELQKLSVKMTEKLKLFK